MVSLSGASTGSLAGINAGTAFAAAGAGSGATSVGSGVPVGAVLPWFDFNGIVPDSDWLLCDGAIFD